MADPAIIDPDLLEHDAETYWQDGADKLTAMSAAVPVPTAAQFSLIPNAQELYGKYVKPVASVQSYIEGGATEYLAFEHLLLRAAIVYDTAQNASAAEIARLEGELAS